MPSSLGYNTARSSTASRRDKATADANSETTEYRAEAPWLGWIPDLDSAHMAPNGARAIENLIPRTDPSGRGEVLTNFPGFDHIESTYGGASRLGDHANTTNHITGIYEFIRTNAAGSIVAGSEYDRTIIAVTGGDASTAGSCQVWRLRPTTGLWQEIVEGSGGSSVALMGSYPDTDRTHQLFDFAVLPASASPRTGLSTQTAGEPIMVFTNNFDNVKIYAVEDAGAGVPKAEDGFYEDLTEALGTIKDFKARSVEAWGDRLNFLNTEEDGVRHRQRLRRTALANGDPDPVNDGSGAIDFRDFQGEGLRVESLGDVLACYFEDGVSFVRRTGNSAFPYTPQTITTERGLLATHSLVNLGGGLHLGIFTDGWFFINENGQFQAAGATGSEGTPTNKWRETFFNRLDINRLERIDMQYDPTNQWVYVTLPLDEATDNMEVWVYDLEGDRMFTRPLSVTTFGSGNVQISAGTTIGSLGTIGDGTIGALDQTIGSFGVRFGLQTLLSGTHNGFVFTADPDLTTEIDLDTGSAVVGNWRYRFTLGSLGFPLNLKVAHEAFIEYVKTTNENMNITLFGNPSQLTETQSVVPSAGIAGDVLVNTKGFRFSSEQIGLELSGTVPVKLRTFGVMIQVTDSRRRRVA